MAESCNAFGDGDVFAQDWGVNAPRGSKGRTKQIIDAAHRMELAGSMRPAAVATRSGTYSAGSSRTAPGYDGPGRRSSDPKGY